MENNTLLLTRVESIESTEMVTEEVKILQSLNLNLQVKVHNLEAEIDRLKKEVQNYKGKNFVYDSLTKDLASLRKQFDRTAVALLKKCEAYDGLKKEVAALKSKVSNSPTGVATPIRSRPPRLIPVAHHLKSTLSLFQEPSDVDLSDDETSFVNRRGRPSMGSCGNIANQIAAEEAMPSCLKAAYAGPSAPLRNRLLTKLHSIKSASTESLESVGRKSIRKQENSAAAKSKSTTPAAAIPIKKPRTILNASQSAKVFTGLTKNTPAPAYRPALGPSNAQRTVKIGNMSSVKRSNSNISNSSIRSASSTKPAFRF